MALLVEADEEDTVDIFQDHQNLECPVDLEVARHPWEWVDLRVAAAEGVAVIASAAEAEVTLAEEIAAGVATISVVAAWIGVEEDPEEDRVEVDLEAVVASSIAVAGGLVVDVVVRRNEEEAHLAPVDPPRGHASISRLPNHPMATPLNHLTKAVTEDQITLTAVSNNRNSNSQ